MRASALLDPAKVLLHGLGDHDMRRRGSDIARVRPVVLPDGIEAVELATLGRRQTVDDPSPAAEGARPALAVLLAAGVPVVSHLCLLDQLPEEGFTFFAVPAKIRGMAAFPVRAFALVE